MVKFGLGKLFQYNSELNCFRVFGRVEVSWMTSGWRYPHEWLLDYNHTDCGCHLLDIAWLGIGILSKDCKGRYE